MSELIRTPRAGNLKSWRPGEPVDHRFLNQTNRAVEQLRAGVNGPRQQRTAGAAAAGAAMFRLVSVHGDYVLATTYDGTTAGTINIPIAKPYLLRRSPFDGETRDGITYSYSSDSARQGDDGSETEDQVVVPSYVTGDVLFALRTLRGTGVTWSPVAGLTEAVVWLDLNLDARAWAKDSA